MGRPRRAGSTGTPATSALTEAGISFTVHEYEHDPRSAAYGTEAAERLGLDPRTVFKTLLVTVDDRTVVAIVPVSGTLDLKALACAAGGRRAVLADATAAQRMTGYVIGGISPIGQKRQLETYLDASASDLAVIYVSGGRRGLDIGIAPKDLIAMTGAQVTPLRRDA